MQDFQMNHNSARPLKEPSIENKPLRMCVWRRVSVNVCVISMCGGGEGGGEGGLVLWDQCTGRRGGGRERVWRKGSEETDDRRRRLIQNHIRKMPNFEGTWKMKSSDKFEELLKALGEEPVFFVFNEGVNVF